MTELPITARTRIHRLSERQAVERQTLTAILDEALIAHVAAVVDGVPVVLPFACARDGNAILLHGSSGAGLLRACAEAQPICVAVTHLDGLVVARSVFDNSMNYRSAVIFGIAQVVTGEDKEQALNRLVDHLLPGRTSEVRPSTAKELAATLVLRLPLDEVSVKIRAEPATTSPDDGEDRRIWAGVLPIHQIAAAPVPTADVAELISVPRSVHAAARRLIANADASPADDQERP
jgi:uncharacterized protein